MKNATTKSATHIQYAFWLTFNRDGAVRVTRGEPDVSRNERAMSCICKLPLSLFATPTLRAEITVSDDGARAFAIDALGTAEVLKAALGIDVDLRIQPLPEAPAT